MEYPPALCFVSHLFLESLTDDIETNAWKIWTTVPLYNSERLALLYSHYPISRRTVFQTSDWCPDNKGASCAEINLFDNLFQPDQIFISRQGQGLASKTYRRKTAVQACRIIRLGSTSGGLQSSPLLKAGELWDQTRLLRAPPSQALKMKDGNCTSSMVKPFPYMALCTTGSGVPLTESFPDSPHRAGLQAHRTSPQASLITWSSLEHHPVYQYLFFVLRLDAVSLMSAKWKGIITFLNLLTMLLVKQPIPNPCCQILVHL